MLSALDLKQKAITLVPEKNSTGSFGWRQQGPEDLFSSTSVEDELLRNELQDLKGPNAFLLLVGCED